MLTEDNFDEYKSTTIDLKAHIYESIQSFIFTKQATDSFWDNDLVKTVIYLIVFENAHHCKISADELASEVKEAYAMFQESMEDLEISRP